MHSSELKEFTSVLDSVCQMLSRGSYAPNTTSTAIFFNTLRAYDLSMVKAAFAAHCADPQRGRFPPVPADILAQIEGAAENDGRPGAEEAWAVCLPASDEARTVVWTAEMAEAWGLARVVLDAGDEVGARMTFRETYSRLIASARKLRAAPQWSATLGHDEAMRADALRAAVGAGRLPLTALPSPAGPVSGLIELVQRPRGVPEHVKAKVQALRFAETPLQQQAREARERDAELKAAHAAKVAEYAAAKGIEVTS